MATLLSKLITSDSPNFEKITKTPEGVSSIKQVLPTIKNKFVGAIHESPAKNVKKINGAISESPLQQKDREHENSLSFFHTPCPARYSVLHFFVLSGKS